MKITKLFHRHQAFPSFNRRKLCSIQCKQKYVFVPQSYKPKDDDIDRLSEFINNHRRLFILTGAGMSTESGIRDYRSHGVGLYATSHQRPIQYSEFIKNHRKRNRYWARNFVAWPIFSSFQPNICHKFVVDMELYGNLHWLVTQNVDSLHKKAGSKKITELHGTTARVACLNCDYEIGRHALQETLSSLNSNWLCHKTEAQGPDGDVIVPDEVADAFKMIDCPLCGGVLKPKVVFFGDNVSMYVKNFLFEKLNESDAMLVIGSSLQVYSSFRFVLGAKDRNIPIAILNIGETRGDRVAQLKISNVMAGDILPRLKVYWNS